MKRTLLALAAATTLAAPAFSASDMFRFEAQATELDNIHSATQLFQRLDAAVMDYCVQLVEDAQISTCHAEVLASVVDQFDNETLNSVYVQATGSAGDEQSPARESGV